MTTQILAPERRSTLARRVRFIVAFTIAYNVIEAAIALPVGVTASSTALIGFGLDSLIEVTSALAVAWQFSGSRPEARERIALRVIALSFFALAAFVTYEAVTDLLTGHEPDATRIGLVLAGVSLLIMPSVAWLERRTGRELGSSTVIADSTQLLLCTAMSAALLAGLGLNAWLGWWWADAVAALVIAALALREGVKAWQGDACCGGGAATLRAEPAEACDCCA